MVSCWHSSRGRFKIAVPVRSSTSPSRAMTAAASCSHAWDRLAPRSLVSWPSSMISAFGPVFFSSSAQPNSLPPPGVLRGLAASAADPMMITSVPAGMGCGRVPAASATVRPGKKRAISAAQFSVRDGRQTTTAG